MIGWALCEARLADRNAGGAIRVGLAALFGASAFVSCALALCASAEVHGILRASNPAAYAQLARVFDTPVAWWERLTAYQGGAMDLTVTFPERPSGSVEPLIVTGVEYQKDYVYVFYTDARRIQLGFDSSLGHSPVLSDVLAVTNWVRIDLDGRTVLSRSAPSDEAAPELIKIGEDQPAGLYGARFSG